MILEVENAKAEELTDEGQCRVNVANAIDRSKTLPWWARLLYAVGRRAVIAWFRLVCRGNVQGASHLEKCLDDGFVLIANHVSYFDWLVLHFYLADQYGITITFLAKDSLFRHPFWGTFVHGLGCIRVSNDGTRIQDSRGFRAMRQARYICVFPEGTRSVTGALGKVHPGGVQIAARRGLQVLPVALEGFFEMWPRHRLLPRPHSCRIVFSTPFKLEKSVAADRAAATEITVRAMHRADSVRQW